MIHIRFKNKINKILIPNIFLDEKLKKDKKKLFMDGIKPN